MHLDRMGNTLLVPLEAIRQAIAGTVTCCHVQTSTLRMGASQQCVLPFVLRCWCEAVSPHRVEGLPCKRPWSVTQLVFHTASAACPDRGTRET